MGVLSGQLLLLIGLSRRLRAGTRQGNRRRPLRPMPHGAMRAADGSPTASGCRPPPSCSKTARRPAASATASPPPRSSGIAHHGSVSSGTSSSREPRYRPEPAASKPISRRTSRLRLRLRAASSSPIRPSRVRTPSRPSGCVGSCLAERYLQQCAGQVDAAQPRIHRLDQARIGVDEMRRSGRVVAGCSRTTARRASFSARPIRCDDFANRAR